MLARVCLLVVLMILTIGHDGIAGPQLVLESKIPLGPVSGRIDHMAVDPKRQRLFVAELGNNTLGVVDLASGKVLQTVTGFSEPQGVGYEPTTDTVYAANANDGSVHILRGEDSAAVGRIELGDDADNIRIDAARNRVLVGFGKGALAILDPTTRKKVADIRLKAHPESFQIDGDQAFVNVPDARSIEVVDLVKGEAAGILPIQGHAANFPMALDRESQRILVVFRRPARLLVLASRDSTVVADLETCGDADDVFVDPKRHRVYVSCGAGLVDIFEESAASYQRVGQIGTAPGARTSLYVPALDRLYVAVRAAGSEPAAIWVFHPVQ